MAGPRPPLLQEPQKYVNEKLGPLFMRLRDSFFICGMRTNENMKYFSNDTVSTQETTFLGGDVRVHQGHTGPGLGPGASWASQGVEAAGPSPWWDSSESLGELEIPSGMLEGPELRARDRAQLVQGERRRLHFIYNQSKDSSPFCPLRTISSSQHLQNAHSDGAWLSRGCPSVPIYCLNS